MIYIDITDFLLYVRKKVKDKTTIIPTGIERVVLEYAMNGIILGKSQCIYYSELNNEYMEIPSNMIFDIYNSNLDNIKNIEYIDVQRMNILRICARYGYKIHKIVFKIIQLWLSTLFSKKKLVKMNDFTKVNFIKSDTVLFLCAPAILRKYYFLRSLKKKYSIKLIMLVQDLMPLTLGKNFIPSIGLKNETEFFIKKSLNIIDNYLVATNSLKNELHDYFKKLGKNITPSVIKFGFGGKNIIEVPSIVEGKFVLTVSTIEVRKNHITLVKTWHQLLKNNRLNSHKLVIVGKWGWKVEPLKRYLEEHKELCEHIVILNNLDDNNLTSLYKNCSFTVFASIAEGYGLPVVESAYHGKLCIASDTPVMREVGGECCIYFNTLDVSDLASKLDYHLNNPEMLQAINDGVSKAKVTSWNDASKYLYETVKQL